MTLPEILLTIAAILVLVPASVLFVQVLVAMFPGNSRLPEQTVRPGLAVIVPAHNEAVVITNTLDSILPQLLSDDRLIVVADNCSDNTAQIAVRSGVEVIERKNLLLRGKGYALDCGVRHLENNPPAIVVVIDADCLVDEGAIDRLARVCNQTARPVQALYLMVPSPGAGLNARIAAFAWVVKNWIRRLGYARLGLPCQLLGTGMAFPWPVVSQAHLANANIVEDMKLSIDLAVNGVPAIFCPDAKVSSSFPEGKRARETQRTRWEHGQLSMLVQELPRLLVGAVIKGDIRLLGFALDFSVPPLALLVLLVSVVFVLALAGAATGLSALPFALTSLAAGLMTTAIILAWHGWGRQVVSFADLLLVPLYVFSKIPIYFKFWTRRQKAWVKTDRE